MTLPCVDHVLLLVDDLDAAAADMTAAGFTVQTRADREVKGGSTYRFVSFPDGSYLLLTAFTPEGAAAHRLARVIAGGQGWADWSFCVADVEAARAAGLAAGLAMGPVHVVANRVASGEEWGLRLLVSGRGSGGDEALPFLVQDRLNRHVRIPAPLPHPNGATGIAGLSVAAADPAASARALAVLLDGPPPVEVEFVPLHPGAPGTAGMGGLVGVTLRGAGTPFTLRGGRFAFSG